MNIPEAILESVELMKQGQLEKSERLLKKVLRKDPDNFDAIHASALIDISKALPGRGMKKLKQLRRRATPQQALLLGHSFGLAHDGLGDLEAAAECYREVYSAKPDAYESGMNLARCLEGLGRYEEAEKICRFLLGTFTKDLEAQFLLIYCKYRRGDVQPALEDFLALALENDLGLAHIERICRILDSHYRYDDLRALATAGLEKYPDAATLQVFIARCDLEASDYATAAHRLESAISGQLPDHVLASLYQELGVVLDRSGNFPAALEAFSSSNEHQRSSYRSSRTGKSKSVSVYRALLQKQDYIDSLNGRSGRSGGSDLCFLVGFPRSGTTLLERVLDAHSAILALPEVDFLHKIIDELGGIEAYPRKLPKLADSELDHLASSYREDLARFPGYSQGKLVIDKNPLLMIHVPLIKSLFPEARLILALRHPADCTLSCFMQNFRKNSEMAHFLSLKETSSRYAEVFGLWNQYQQHLHLQGHTICYENLVADLENEASRLMNFLGLESEPDQLRFYEKAQEKGGIRTPSYRQVSKPIYSSSSYRWKNYDFAMQEYLPVLQPFIEQFGYAE